MLGVGAARQECATGQDCHVFVGAPQILTTLPQLAQAPFDWYSYTGRFDASGQLQDLSPGPANLDTASEWPASVPNLPRATDHVAAAHVAQLARPPGQRQLGADETVDDDADGEMADDATCTTYLGVSRVARLAQDHSLSQEAAESLRAARSWSTLPSEASSELVRDTPTLVDEACTRPTSSSHADRADQDPIESSHGSLPSLPTWPASLPPALTHDPERAPGPPAKHPHRTNIPDLRVWRHNRQCDPRSLRAATLGPELLPFSQWQ
ncbi:uncharacterized protein MONBRDRAFT_12226 [Monosiga brevicollis MX1]|uniref:Uncharacterized protein n=1 Tax=Monosiga brevicollis TaxID=81824 RepID=A9VBL2_MONBE|nr:uncharacterized protein MONBRDRAFT_12226 [Monosiga brevicollis MX1]EDQ85116.1 predicted protein [Monosiga brevicollis MX1]|eukprot:XP_001750120.1 hypothetical protein [Monosiga brevicollis MX1]